MYRTVHFRDSQYNSKHCIGIFSITSLVQWEVLLGKTSGFEFELHPYLEISITRSHIPEELGNFRTFFQKKGSLNFTYLRLNKNGRKYQSEIILILLKYLFLE